MTPLAQPRQSGFTLIELLVVVTIVAITAAIALPSFNDSITRNRIASQSNEFIAAVNLARTASLELNSGGGVCGANTTLTDCGGGWENGWLVWADRNRDGAVGANEIISIGRISRDDRLVGVADIRFDGRGRRVQPAPGAGVASLELQPLSCASGKEHRRVLSINPLGSVTVSKGVC